MIEPAIKQALAKLGLPELEFSVERPSDLAHGDYATNVALVLAKQTGEKPVILAAKIAEQITNEKNNWLAKVEVAGPGFINFTLSPEFFSTELAKILAEGERYGRGELYIGQKVMIEYTDPNPFKEFHIGHLMSNTVGETLSRLIEWQGAEVKRVCYQGDVGLHVAKALWGKQQDSSRSWGEAYAAGAQAYEADEETKSEIAALNKKIYERSDAAINQLYDDGRAASLAEFEKMYARLGTKFDHYFFESVGGPRGKKIVEENIGKVFEKSDGAVVFKGEQYGLHTRVFLNRDGLPTYEAKELGLAGLKYETYPYTRSIIVTANEVSDYFRVLLKALELVAPELAAKTQHVAHGLLRLPSGKMSSRTGTIITAEALLADLLPHVRENEPVAIGAIKYAILKQAPGRDVIFDLAKSVSLEGDSGPYLQYAAVRAAAVVAKAERAVAWSAPDLPEPATPLVRLLPHFAEVAARAARDGAPQLVAGFLIELASAYNAFYAEYKILGHEHETYRLALTAATRQVLANGLWLLGIPMPERM